MQMSLCLPVSVLVVYVFVFVCVKGGMGGNNETISKRCQRSKELSVYKKLIHSAVLSTMWAQLQRNVEYYGIKIQFPVYLRCLFCVLYILGQLLPLPHVF